jgi:hypothetical protein
MLVPKTFAVFLKPYHKAFNRSAGTCYEAQVWSIQRRAGSLVVRCDALPRALLQGTASFFVVQWQVQERLVEAARLALDTFESAFAPVPSSSIAETLPSVVTPFELRVDSLLAKSWLFPELTDLQDGIKAPADPLQMDWVDSQLNEERASDCDPLCTPRTHWQSEKPSV